MKVVVYNDNSIAAIREEISYQSNGNVITDRGQAIAEILVKGVYNVEEIPSEVEEYKYCYTEEKGFYKNENYKELVNQEEIETRVSLVEERITLAEDIINQSLGF